MAFGCPLEPAGRVSPNVMSSLYLCKALQSAVQSAGQSAVRSALQSAVQSAVPNLQYQQLLSRNYECSSGTSATYGTYIEFKTENGGLLHKIFCVWCVAKLADSDCRAACSSQTVERCAVLRLGAVCKAQTVERCAVLRL